MPGIERIPARPCRAVEVDLELGVEVHLRRVLRNADVTEIPRGVARRDVHASGHFRDTVGSTVDITGAPVRSVTGMARLRVGHAVFR